MTHAPNPQLPCPGLAPIAPFDITGFLGQLWRGKWLVGAVTTLMIGLAGYYAFAMAQPQFAASATVRIAAHDPFDAAAPPEVAGLPMDPLHLKTEVAVLRSPHLMRQVVDELDLLSDPAFNRYLTPIQPWSVTDIRNRLRSALTGQPMAVPDAEGIVDKTLQNLSAKIVVAPLRETYIFRITATTGDPEMSARIANTLAQAYLNDQIIAKSEATEDTFLWLSERVGQLKTTLEQQETAINQVVTTHRADDPEVLDALSRQSIETRNRIRDTEQALLSAEIRLAGLKPMVTDASLAAPLGRAQTLAETRRLMDQITSLRQFQSDIDAQLNAQSTHQVRLQQLQREAEATRVLYQTFLSRLQETSAQRGPQNADGRILARAVRGQYVGPRKVLILLMAGIIGLSGGSALVVIRDAFRRRFASADAVSARLGLPVLAQMPPLKRGTAMLDQLNADPVATAMRALRTQLILTGGQPDPQVILLTAPQQDNAKTAQVLGLGQAFANMDKRVLIIASDPRAPQLSRSAETLETVIAGKSTLADAIYRDPRLAADILQIGDGSGHLADLLAGDGFAVFMQSAREIYDVIIVDAPSVPDGPEAALLSHHADPVIYVIRPDKTHRDQAAAGLAALEQIGAPVRGVALTHVKARQRHRQFSAQPAMA